MVEPDMQDKVEPLTADELGLLQYLFWRHREDCYDEIGAVTERSTKYNRMKSDLVLLSEIERKLEVHLT